MAVQMLKLGVLMLAAGVLAAGCGKQAETPGSPAVNSGRQQGLSGEILFRQYCAACHPGGGNVTDPGRTLHAAALKRHHISTPDDIVRIMRNPRSRMIRFDRSMLSDRDAVAIAEYVLKEFR